MSLSKTLQRSISVEFYSAHLTPLLIALVFVSGFMRSQDHLALAEYFTTSPTLMLIPVGIWSVYGFAVFSFHRAICRRPSHVFIRDVLMFRIKSRWLLFTSVVTLELAPLYFYAAFLAAVAVKGAEILSIAISLSSVITLTILLVAALNNDFTIPVRERRTSALKRFFERRFNRPFVLFPIEWAMRRNFFPVAALKLAATGGLIAILYLYKTDEYDIRLAGSMIPFVFALNTTSIYLVHRFLYYDFALYKNQPFTRLQRLGHALMTTALFTTPELAVLIRHWPDNLPGYGALSVYLLGLSVNMLYYSYLFRKSMKQEQSMIFLYFSVIVAFLVVMSRLPVEWVAFGYFSGSFILFQAYHDTFEYLEKST